jgi:phosphoenolpyruvate phosphomutase
VDIDTGYGDIEQVVRAVKTFDSLGASAVCMEDNIFPKTNSLWGKDMPIMDMKEFGAKIKASKEVSKNLLIIARTEALIRGHGKGEALRRAKYYVDCGADIILMHTKEKTGQEALIMSQMWWKENIPLVIIPSKFPHLTNKELFSAGYSIIIYANQTQRAKIFGVKKALKILKTEQNAKALDGCIASLDEFRNLTPIEETKKRKERYGK